MLTNRIQEQRKKIFNFEFILTIVFLFTLFYTIDGFVYGKFLLILLMSLVFLVKNKELKFDRSIFIFYLFLILVGASGIYGERNEFIIGNMITLFACFMLLIIIPLIVNNEERLEIFISFTIYFGFFLSLYVISLTDIERLLQGRYYASLVLFEKIGNRNSVAILIGIAFNFGIYKILYRHRYAYIPLISFMLMAVLLTGSRKGLLLCVIPLFINLALISLKSNIRRKILYTTLFIILTISLHFIIFKVDFLYQNIGWRIESIYSEIILNESSEESSFNVRQEMIQYGFEYFKEKPFFGYGIENYRYLYGVDSGFETYSHNNYIEILVNNGLIGFILYYSFFIIVIIKANIKRRASTIVAEKNFYTFIITILMCLLIMDVAVISYKWFPYYILLALALKGSWNKENINRSILNENN
ncbi:O-antigen ligase family protein [Alkalihalobacterium alkalinitrilicum]|uniref:O-antigen ligase family protein n=1 Tax=Alkalihalobacterium alkalinitrilicum TaxID=427920 RepID=UPI0009951F52|nr:O-antigen ligase family protein [Alkalihalobacterium alkalinitrilicum]